MSKSLVPLRNDAFGKLVPFLPDTPWTTTTLHVLLRRKGTAYVDSQDSPRNVVVVTDANHKRGVAPRAFLFGNPQADGLREFMAGVDGKMEFVCDEEMAPLVQSHYPDANEATYVVAWFDSFEVDLPRDSMPGLRRIRSSDADNLEKVLPAEALRTFGSGRDMLMAGAAYGVVQRDEIVCVAFTVDHSVKFERIAVYTDSRFRRKGMALACTRRLATSCGDRGRVPCCIIRSDCVEGFDLAKKVGFPQMSRMKIFSKTV